MEKSQIQKSELRSALPVVCALLFFVISIAYIIYRTMSNRAYNEKWKDYDECGLS